MLIYTIVHATNWQNITSGMFHNKLVLVCPRYEHLSSVQCRPIGWVGLQLWVFIQNISYPAGCTNEWKSMHFMSPSILLSKSTTVMIRGVNVVNA